MRSPTWPTLPPPFTLSWHGLLLIVKLMAARPRRASVAGCGCCLMATRIMNEAGRHYLTGTLLDTVLCRVSGRPDRGRLNVRNSGVSNTRLWDLSRTVPISRQGSACSANITAITCCVVQLIEIGATMTVHSRPLLTTIGGAHIDINSSLAHGSDRK